MRLGNKLNTCCNKSHSGVTTVTTCITAITGCRKVTTKPRFHYYVRFEHTQRNISLPKQCTSLPKLKPEDPWTQNYEAKQWNIWIFSNNKKWNYASSDPVKMFEDWFAQPTYWTTFSVVKHRCATLADCRLANLQTCRLADLKSQHTSSSYPKSFLKRWFSSKRTRHRFPMKLGMLLLQDKEILKT